MRGLMGMMALGLCGALALTGCSLLGTPDGDAAPGFVLRVNTGTLSTDQPYTDKAGHVWLNDKDYTEGGGYGFSSSDVVDRGADVEIKGTEDDRIYQTERWGMTGFTAELPNGNYTVILHFAETYDGIADDGPRVFDVTIQGKTVLDDFDVSKAAGAVETALVKKFSGVAVTDGKLQIGFTIDQQQPEINGIEIIAE